MFRVSGIAKKFGQLQVFSDLSLEFSKNKITAILGPSGCGKTTALKILAGLVKPDQGIVESTEKLSFLFQEPRLLPWLNIHQNLALILQDKIPDVDNQIGRYLKAVGLGEYYRFYPGQLSGGMKQRAAMARALSYPAELLLMDEPFKSLDLRTRYQLVSDFLALWRQKPNTVVVVTHDVKEAVWLGDRILVLSEKPARLVERFENEFPPESRMSGDGLGDLEQIITRAVLKG
ncbi:MAG: ABC transporter ATP-binding protein [Bacteroidota bacterium]